MSKKPINANDVQLFIGDRLINNDPRMRGKVLIITEIFQNGVSAIDSHGIGRMYLRKRIFTDGKRRKSGMCHVPIGPRL